jgi:hypothetical protein
MHLAETKAMMEALRTRPEAPTSGEALPDQVTPEAAEKLADSLIMALRVARPIVAREDNVDNGSHLTEWVHATVVSEIDDCLQKARETFPNAQLFRAGPSALNERLPAQ